MCNTLEQALLQRGHPIHVRIHSDRGSQYCSDDFKRLIVRYQLQQSMSCKGNCWDNAVAESFFHTLKAHVVHGCHYPT